MSNQQNDIIQEMMQDNVCPQCDCLNGHICINCDNRITVDECTKIKEIQMKQFNLVDINSDEFEIRILQLLSKHSPKITTITRFIPLPDGWVRDLTTGLDWGKSSTNEMNHASAKTYAQDKGGRLPTMKELQGLVDYTKHGPCIDKDLFPDTKSTWYWTNDVTAWTKNSFWVVSVYRGYVGGSDEGGYNYVRPVRASQ